MKIAVLAWGSLIWEPRGLKTSSEFAPTGPVLPIEFSRVSGGRRLTLVIDDNTSAACQTYVATSKFDKLDEALQNLWIREGTGDEQLPQQIRASTRVAFVDIGAKAANKHALRHNPKAVEAICSWAIASSFDAVIWTGLVSDFLAKTGKTFSVAAAIEHIAGLAEAELATALHYVRKAPPEVQTPVRAAVTARWPQG